MDVRATAPNLVLRAYRGPEDHPAMSDVAAAGRADNGERELGTVAELDNHYAHLDQAALPRDCALAVLDGRGGARRARDPMRPPRPDPTGRRRRA